MQKERVLPRGVKMNLRFGSTESADGREPTFRWKAPLTETNFTGGAITHKRHGLPTQTALSPVVKPSSGRQASLGPTEEFWKFPMVVKD